MTKPKKISYKLQSDMELMEGPWVIPGYAGHVPGWVCGNEAAVGVSAMVFCYPVKTVQSWCLWRGATFLHAVLVSLSLVVREFNRPRINDAGVDPLALQTDPLTPS
jgi:hypothetical protein